MPGSDLYLARNACSFTALALSPISFFLFHFVLSENNLKTISTGLLEKWQTLVPCSTNTSLTLNCLRIQCQDNRKLNKETNTAAARGHKTYTCTIKNPELDIFWTGKQTKRKICLEIFVISWGSWFVCLKKKNLFIS